MKWLLVLVVGLCWLLLLARLVQGHIEGAWRYLAWTVVGLLAVLLLRYASTCLRARVVTARTFAIEAVTWRAEG